jgi:hypothetical protein
MTTIPEIYTPELTWVDVNVADVQFFKDSMSSGGGGKLLRSWWDEAGTAVKQASGSVINAYKNPSDAEGTPVSTIYGEAALDDISTVATCSTSTPCAKIQWKYELTEF